MLKEGLGVGRSRAGERAGREGEKEEKVVVKETRE